MIRQEKKKQLQIKKIFYNGKKAMAAAWSDEDTSSSSGQSEAKEQIGLMIDHEVTSPPSTSHSFMSNCKLTDDDEQSHEELVEALFEVCCKFKSMNKEKKSLQKSLETILLKKIAKRVLKSYF